MKLGINGQFFQFVGLFHGYYTDTITHVSKKDNILIVNTKLLADYLFSNNHDITVLLHISIFLICYYII